MKQTFFRNERERDAWENINIERQNRGPPVLTIFRKTRIPSRNIKPCGEIHNIIGGNEGGAQISWERAMSVCMFAEGWEEGMWPTRAGLCRASGKWPSSGPWFRRINVNQVQRCRKGREGTTVELSLSQEWHVNRELIGQDGSRRGGNWSCCATATSFG